MKNVFTVNAAETGFFLILYLCFQSSLTHAAHMYFLFLKLGSNYSLVIRKYTFYLLLSKRNTLTWI